MKSTRFAIVGCGKLGRTLAWHLPRRGFAPAGFASRRRASAQAAAEAAGGGTVCGEAEEAAAEADVVFITTPDGEIGPVVERLVSRQAVKAGAVVLHCSGALPSTVLFAVRSCGAHAGSLHPLQSFAAPVFPDNPFRGIVMAGEGDAAALTVARQLAVVLEAEFLPIQTENKVLYHAAAVVASNYMVALMAAAGRLLEASGIDTDAVLKVLLPLVHGTLRNVEARGVADALTGPIARGDAATVAAHCRAIQQALPDLTAFYGVLGAQTLELARSRGDLHPAAARELEVLLSPGSKPIR